MRIENIPARDTIEIVLAKTSLLQNSRMQLIAAHLCIMQSQYSLTFIGWIDRVLRAWLCKSLYCKDALHLFGQRSAFQSSIALASTTVTVLHMFLPGCGS